MKYILFAFITAITLSFATYGCQKETAISIEAMSGNQCTSPTSCPTRAEKIVCDLNTLTRAGKIKEDWVPMNSLVSDKRYYRLGMDGGSIVAHEQYTVFYITMSAGNSTSIDVKNECAKELFQYLEIVKGFNIEDEKQKVILDFLDDAEKQFGVQQEE